MSAPLFNHYGKRSVVASTFELMGVVNIRSRRMTMYTRQSVLEEPPVDRTPIQTYVMEYNEEMVREAINRELARNGQVYYVYNRVTDIDEVAGRVQALVPDAVVTFAHGQMRRSSPGRHFPAHRTG